jgi:hypothetical protein
MSKKLVFSCSIVSRQQLAFLFVDHTFFESRLPNRVVFTFIAFSIEETPCCGAWQLVAKCMPVLGLKGLRLGEMFQVGV